MTDPPVVSSRSAILSRRLAWLVIACAVASLALTITNRFSGASVRWTAWALPLLIAANAAVLLRGRVLRRPLLVRLYVVVSLGLAAAIIASETRLLVHR